MPIARIKLRGFPEGTLLSLVALAFNSFVSLFGASGISKELSAVVYSIVLIVCGYLLFGYIFGKYMYLYSTHQWKPCCHFPKDSSRSGFVQALEYYSEGLCRKHLAYDIFNCFMIFCYLVGDNLKQMVCDPECGRCPMIAQFFTGISLLLNLTLILLKDGGGLSKGSLSSTLPVTGKRGGSYNKMLQIAAKVLIIDQALTAILEHISTRAMDSECAKMPVNNNSGTQLGFIIAYFVVIVLISVVVMVFLVWGERKTFCPHDCCDKEKCCENCCEPCGQWCFAFCTLIFVALFMVADIDWFWDLWKDSIHYTDARIARVCLLSLSFLFCLILILLYICIIALPGLGIVLKKKQNFLPEHGVHGVLRASESMQCGADNTWKSADEHPPSVPSPQMRNAEQDEKVDSDSTDTYSDKCKLKKSVKVQDDFGEATISFTFKEEIPCCEGFRFIMCSCKNLCKWNLPEEGKESHWIMKANVGEAAKVTIMERSTTSTS